MGFLSDIFGSLTSSPSPPTEAPNSLQSDTIARMVELVSEGEIEGLVAGLQSVYFDGTALQNLDGSFNYKNVTVATRTGTVGQTSIPGFSDVETEVDVSTQVKKGSPGPLVRTITNAAATSARVTIQIPQLSLTDPSTGDIGNNSAAIKIELQPNGGSYATVVTDTISGKCTSPYERAYRFLLTGTSPWNIRVTRTNGDSTLSSSQNETIWASYTEIVDFQFSYPYSALVAVALDAKSFGGSLPTRNYLEKGLKVSVPANYNPVTRAYATTGPGTSGGAWDGTFRTAWTDNPAWVFYDLIANDRYGLGQFVPAASIDKFGLYTIAQYCDALVPDGAGGQEPRYTFNGVISAADDAIKVLVTLAAVFRGMVYWGNAGVTAVADMPGDPVKLITPANVVGGTINYQGAALKARHSVAQVTWYDPTDFYQATIEVVEDQEAIQKFGYRLTEIVAFGCTSRGQAHRMGLWLLDSEKNQTETATWQASWDQADVVPGDIVEVADPAYSGVDFGGRVAGVTLSGGSVVALQLDRPVTIEAGKTYSISYVAVDGSIQTQPLTDAPATITTVHLGSALPDAPVTGAIWVITSSAVAPRQFSVITRAETDKHLFDITALLHDPTKYPRIEQGITLETSSFTALTVGAVAAPTALTSVEGITLSAGGTARSRVVVSWTPSADQRVTLYQVQESPPGQNWQDAGETSGSSLDLLDLPAGSWGFRVRAITGLGQVSPWLSLDQVTLAGMLAPPADVSSFFTSYVDATTYLTWPEIADPRPHRYEVRRGVSWATGLAVGDVAHPPFSSLGDGTYWVAPYIGPSSGPKTYSTSPPSLTIFGSVLTNNVIAVRDQKASGWKGTFTGAGIDGADIRTAGAGDITTETDITTDPDITDFGGQASGTYTIPAGDRISIGRVASCRVIITWNGQGVPAGQDITTEADITLDPDITGSAATRFVDVYPEIRLSQDGGATWGAWFRFASGVQTFSEIDARLQLVTTDPTVIAYGTAFTLSVDVPDRDDHSTDFAVGIGGATIAFTPDGSGTPAPFNGGPGSAILPAVQVTVHGGANYKITGKTLSGMTIQCFSDQACTTPVADTVDLLIQGY